MAVNSKTKTRSNLYLFLNHKLCSIPHSDNYKYVLFEDGPSNSRALTDHPKIAELLNYNEMQSFCFERILASRNYKFADTCWG